MNCFYANLVAVDPLNENGCFLIVPFTADAGGAEETDVCLFEMTLEDRNGVYQVHLDNGPRLSGLEGKVTSASLEYMGSNYKLWLLNQTEDGHPKVKCISFKGNATGNQHGHGGEIIFIYLFVNYDHCLWEHFEYYSQFCFFRLVG